IAQLLLALDAVVGERIAGLAAHGARQLGAPLVGPRPLAPGAAAGPLRVLQLAEDVEAPLAHAVGRLRRRLARQAVVQLLAARPRPGVLAARRPAADLAVGDVAEFALAGAAHAPRRLVGQPGGVGVDLLVLRPHPLLLAAGDAARDLAIPELAVHRFALRALERR